MASTNKTANLQLNQWVSSDPFLMEDMNSDNQKIDSAVAAAAAAAAAAATASLYVKLMDVTTSANAVQVDLGVSAIDFSKYAMIQIFADMQVTPLSVASYVYAKINNSGGYEVTTYNNTSLTSQSYVGRSFAGTGDVPIGMRMEISGFLKAAQPYMLRIRSSAITEHSTMRAIENFSCMKFTAGTKPTSINFVTDSASAYIKAGSRFLIYGVKV